MSLIRAFTAHPSSLGESYFEHLLQAMCFGARMVGAGFACLIHGVFPFLFEHTGSRTIETLNERMLLRRRGVAPRLVNEKRLSA
jgi:Family of unknown function (DUF6356)